MSNPRPAYRFPAGNTDGLATRFGNGQVNPGGKTKLQREFEAAMYAALCDGATAEAAIDGLKKAIQKGESWAISLYFSKVLPPSFHVKLSRQEEEDERDEPDLSRLTSEEFEQLNRLLEKACAHSAGLLEPGENPPGPEGVR